MPPVLPTTSPQRLLEVYLRAKLCGSRTSWLGIATGQLSKVVDVIATESSAQKTQNKKLKHELPTHEVSALRTRLQREEQVCDVLGMHAGTNSRATVRTMH